MWNYYIATKAALAAHTVRTDTHCVGHLAVWHYFETAAEIILCAKFQGPEAQDLFEAEPGVIAFPAWHSNHPIGKEIAARLAAHGVSELDTTFDAAKKIRKHHPAFDPRIF